MCIKTYHLIAESRGTFLFFLKNQLKKKSSMEFTACWPHHHARFNKNNIHEPVRIQSFWWVQHRGMRDYLEAPRCIASREKACCAQRTIPAFEPLWPCLGPQITYGLPLECGLCSPEASKRQHQTKATQEPKVPMSTTNVYFAFMFRNIESRRAQSRAVKLLNLWVWPN